MNHPVQIDRFIKLITKNELNKNDVKLWYKTVIDCAPSGTIKPVFIIEDQPKSIALVHRVDDKNHNYIIPITRDLSEKEIKKIVDVFADKKPDLDFNIETNETQLLAKNDVAIKLDSSKHIELCNALAKKQHEDWVKERIDAGWRYGTTFDTDDKTHPLIRPWGELPDRYKQPDLSWPQKLINVLNDQGYLVIDKKELENILYKLK